MYWILPFPLELTVNLMMILRKGDNLIAVHMTVHISDVLSWRPFVECDGLIKNETYR